MRGGALALVGLLGLARRHSAGSGRYGRPAASCTCSTSPASQCRWRPLLRSVRVTPARRSRRRGPRQQPARQFAIAAGTIRGGQLALRPRRPRARRRGTGPTRARPRGVRSIPTAAQLSAPFLYARSNVEGTAFEPQRDLAKRSYGLDGGGSIAADTAATSRRGTRLPPAKR